MNGHRKGSPVITLFLELGFHACHAPFWSGQLADLDPLLKMLVNGTDVFGMKTYVVMRQ
jgi:hypothetical protein